MYNSILHFTEKGIKNIEEIIKNFMEDGMKNLGELVIELDKPIQELQRNIIEEVIEEVDAAFRNDKIRKKNYYVVKKEEPNRVLTT